jgi:hypothetical protein
MPDSTFMFRLTFCASFSLLAAGLACAQPPAPPPPGPAGGPPPPPRAARSPQAEALDAITHAYDSLNRVAALATSASATGAVSPGGLLAQGQTAYQEALSQYQAQDLTAARELATAANDLARAIDELTMSDAGHAAAQIPPPPAASMTDQALRTNADLARAGRAILEARRTLDATNTMPATTVTQAKALIASSQDLQQRGQALLNQGQPRGAASLARAADALAHAASHLQNPALIAAGLRPAAPPPPPPPPPHAGPPPPPERGRQN